MVFNCEVFSTRSHHSAWQHTPVCLARFLHPRSSPGASILQSHCYWFRSTSQRRSSQSRCQTAVRCQQSDAAQDWWRNGAEGSTSSPQKGKDKRRKILVKSDGSEHLGSALSTLMSRPFPGPPSGQGPPIRILPIGGLGEIGMNCMLIGVYDRYILVDAGLMFPDFTDLGMQKILPDTSFLARWRDKIEAVIITHGHEDHIGAIPWVLPALDPSTPFYAGNFAMQLIKRRLQEFNLWDESRFRTIKMRERFQLGPFECEPIRVTHSIPDCCGMILRNQHGNIVHTGDWKIDETPVDGDTFDRDAFEQIGREGVTLFMSDSTNVLAPGRTFSEAIVQDSLHEHVLRHNGKGRVITTQFASNLHRLSSVKKAADAAGRKLCFIGMSLTTYLEAAAKDNRAPFDVGELVSPADLESANPNEVLIVTTGSQAEPRSALTLAAREASHTLKLLPSDLLLYSAKVIPGNETRVTAMMNSIAELGPRIVMGSAEKLHTSGHAYKGELEEVLRLVKPQHFLPVHGEYAFLTAHARLARESAGVEHCSVIRNGQMLGVANRRSGKEFAQGSMLLLGKAKLVNFYNDGNKGTGTDKEMALEERSTIAVEGVVVASVDVIRPGLNPALRNGGGAGGQPEVDEDSGRIQWGLRDGSWCLQARVRVTTRAMWVDQGRLLQRLHEVSMSAVAKLPGDATLVAVERGVAEAIRRCCKQYNGKKPEIIVVTHEMDPRAGERARQESLEAAELRADRALSQQAGGAGAPRKTAGRAKGRGTGVPAVRGAKSPGSRRPWEVEEMMASRRAANPRDNPQPGTDVEYP